jgi:hypothetical protein
MLCTLLKRGRPIIRQSPLRDTHVLEIVAPFKKDTY